MLTLYLIKPMNFKSSFNLYILVLLTLNLTSCSSEGDVLVSNVVESTNTIIGSEPTNSQSTTVTSQEIVLTSNSTNSFLFTPDGTLSDKPIDVFYHIPDGEIKNFPILFSFHGNSRNASNYRNYWIEMANENKFMVFAPKFDDINFEGGDKYNLANIFDDGDNPSIESYNPPELWSFSVIDELFDFIVSKVEGNQTNYNAWGHSAGAQFLHRFLLYLPNSKLNTGVISNAGWYTVPVKDFDFPYGIANSQLEDSTLVNAFSKKLYVHLGKNDTNPNSSGLRHNDVVDLQGLNRFDRGKFYFQRSSIKSESLNGTFNWEKIEVPDVDHNASLMALDALQYILQE